MLYDQRVEKRTIILPRGGILEVDIHPGFYEALRKQFMLAPEQEVTDDHVRMFVHGSINSAINKFESDPSIGPDGGHREQQR